MLSKEFEELPKIKQSNVCHIHKTAKAAKQAHQDYADEAAASQLPTVQGDVAKECNCSVKNHLSWRRSGQHLQRCAIPTSLTYCTRQVLCWENWAQYSSLHDSILFVELSPPPLPSAPSLPNMKQNKKPKLVYAHWIPEVIRSSSAR